MSALFAKTQSINSARVRRYFSLNFMRIAGVEIPENKIVEFSLLYIYGIGKTRAREIVREAGISPLKRISDLTSQELAGLRKAIEGRYVVEGDLRREVSANIKRLKDVQSYRGSRHAKSLPVKGQRTKTNSRTRRGNVRKTMGSGRRKLDKK